MEFKNMVFGGLHHCNFLWMLLYPDDKLQFSKMKQAKLYNLELQHVRCIGTKLVFWPTISKFLLKASLGFFGVGELDPSLSM